MADAVEAVWQGMQEEATDELVGGKGHHLGPAVMSIVAPAEADLSLFDAEEPAVGDGHAMGVAAEIGEDLVGVAEGWLGIDDPLELSQLVELPLEGGLIGEAGKITVEAEGASIECGAKLVQEQPPEEL